jgi:hypothetical protein
MLDHAEPSWFRIFMPLREVEDRFGGWTQFFQLLSEYVQGKNDDFAGKFKRKKDLLKDANEVFDLKPRIFGTSVNLNGRVEWHERSARRSSDRASPNRKSSLSKCTRASFV